MGYSSIAAEKHEKACFHLARVGTTNSSGIRAVEAQARKALGSYVHIKGLPDR